jgi:hypothetical protein
MRAGLLQVPGLSDGVPVRLQRRRFPPDFAPLCCVRLPVWWPLALLAQECDCAARWMMPPIRAKRDRPAPFGCALVIGAVRRPPWPAMIRDEGGAFPRKAHSPANTGCDDRHRTRTRPRHPPDPRPLGRGGVRHGGVPFGCGRADAYAPFADETALDPMSFMPPPPRPGAPRRGAPESEAE